MKKLALVCMFMLLAAAIAVAQSSGNFSYGNTGSTHCVLNGSNGHITGGATCAQSSVCGSTGCTIVPDPNQQDCAGSLAAGIKTNSGAGNVFVVEPSAVIGLLTNVTVQKNATVNIGTSSAYAGVDFEVKVTDPSGNAAKTIPNFPVTYDARFIQISTNLFDVLGTQCTGTNTIGGVTTADGCYISFNMSTVSAHSFQWIVPELQTGVYGIAANWKASLGNTGISNSLTCVGPVNMTVQQNKVFSFNTIN
ncbi:MAG TPA: hypothetical protein VEV41_17425 [Terriglobales bacterium]|nr:hypothetical protein [Terriglobales bacterium]